MVSSRIAIKSHHARYDGVTFAAMEEDPVRKFLAEIGRRGGKARAKALTKEEQRAIARKASKAAAKARTQKAKERKAEKHS